MFFKMSAIDPEGKYLAVAGTSGFTHFSFLTRKWKIFGNADQEKEIRITGGILWWKEFICMSCFNVVDQKDEVNFIELFHLKDIYYKISLLSYDFIQEIRIWIIIIQKKVVQHALYYK